MPTSKSFVYKPAGIPTHQIERSSDPFHWGLSEYLASQTDQPYLVVHRLDKATSGVMAFAHTPEMAAEMAQAFQEQQVRKEYLFVTDRTLQKNPEMGEILEHEGGWQVRSHIERKGSRFVSHTHAPFNSETTFQLLRTEGSYSLWQANPLTGRSHQIRLHAQALGLSIVGDSEHGGTPFVRLLLHARKLTFDRPELGSGEAPLPFLLEDMTYLSDSDLSRWICGFERRKHLFPHDGHVECRRWLHTDGGQLRADRYGPITFFYWFGNEAPTPALRQRIETLTRLFSIRHWYLRWMKDRGSGVQELALWKSQDDIPETWIAQEIDLRFELSAQGFSPGLFLDQRANRAWVKKVATSRTVLNLFCYTGGFSVAAAKGGASKVVSVDLSQNFLRWLKRNFQHNDINPDDHEIWSQDARLFLQGAHRKSRRFDLIICDPPSFARGTGGVFRVEKDLPKLIEQMSHVLAPGGEILLCTNYEKWTREEFQQVVKRAAQPYKLELQAAPCAEWDFEGPGVEPILKSIKLVSRASR